MSDVVHPYKLPELLSWPDSPSKFSFSLLNTLRGCPRKWQLANAKYAGWEGGYPRPYARQAVFGQVTHDLLQELVVWLVKQGSPARGTPEFGAAMQSFGMPGRIQGLMEKQLGDLKKNPRASRVKELGFNTLDVQNRVFQLLISTWSGKAVKDSAAEATGGKNLPEERVDHPRLPLFGYLDLVEVRPDGDVITDYKTGEMSDSYRDQILLYALLWWRRQGRLPRLLRVVPVVGDRLELVATEAELEGIERGLEGELERWRTELAAPVCPVVSEETCKFCHVRAHCDEYWSSDVPARANSDLSGTVTKVRSSASLTAQIGANSLEVTASPGSSVDLARLMSGDRFRVLSAAMADDGSATLTQYSELYLVPEAANTAG